MIKYLLRTRRKSSGCCGKKRDAIKYRVVHVNEAGEIERISEAYGDPFKLAKAEGQWQEPVNQNLIADFLSKLNPTEIQF